MNRKQNSLMRFSRTERLAQLSEQEIVIERKKREIQAKIEAQKKKETEEALRKLESSRDAKTNKPGFSKKPFSRSDEREKDKSVEQEKKESLINAFSNDGSFLDQFKKLSRTGITPGNVEVQMLARSKQDGDESKGSNFQVERSGNDRYQEKYIDRDKNDSSYLPPLDSNFQQQLPPGVNQSVPQQQVPLMAPIGQNMSLVPPPLGHMPSSQSFINNPPQLNSMSSTSSYQETPQPVPPVQNQLGGSSTMPSETMPYDHLSRIQPPLPITPQSIPPPSPIQVQNIPPPPVLSKDSDLLPKNRTESITMTLKNNTVKKLDLIPNPLDTDDATTPPPAKKPLSSVSEKKETSHFGISHYSVPVGCSSQKEESTRISSAFYYEDCKDDGETSDLKHRHWAEMVARCGDDFENTLRNRHENDPNLRFLFDKNSKEYVSYRKLVAKYRRNLEKSSEDEKSVKESLENEVNPGENVTSGSAREGKLSRQGSSDSHSSTKDSNADKLSRQKSETRPGNDGYQADNEEDLPYYKMPESAKKDCFIPSQRQTALKEERRENSNEAEKESSDQSRIEERRKRKRKSRWGDAVPTSSTSIGATPVTLQPSGNLPAPKTTLLSQLTRSDPGLIQYARQTFGSTNLSEEDWKKAEDHYKINLLYQDMVKKRAEIDKLERAGKFKYEYDSDEDVEGGTWEHKLRQQEMMATQLWAEELTRQAAGKHHIGDFLPPEELERFMEKYNAVKEGREPDLSDYKEFKLKQDNVGYRLLQKMGWNEGQGLGQDGSGITNPVNKATTRHENQGLGIDRPDGLEAGDDEYDAYRKRMMLAYRFRPNPLNNPRRPYY